MISRYEENACRGLGRFEGLMSLHEAAKAWGLEDSTVRKAILSGRLREGMDARKFGKQWVVTRDAMEREFNGRRMVRKLALQIKQEQEVMQRMDEMIWPD